MGKRKMAAGSVIVAAVLCGMVLPTRADYTNGLVARWTFDYADKTFDDIGANSVLTVSNGVTFSKVVTFGPGPGFPVSHGLAAFDGTTTALLNAGRGTNAELDITPALTIWMRANLNVTGTWHSLATRWGTTATNQSYIWYVRPPTLCNMQMSQRFRTYTNATDYLQSADIALPQYNYTNYYGSFHNVALVFNPTNAANYGAWKFYVDGTQIAWATAYKLTNSVAGGYWNVGTWTSETEPLIFGYLLGEVDEIRVYNQVLGPTELNEIVPYVVLPSGVIISFH